MVFVNRARAASDPSFNLWPSVLSTQVVQTTSFISACVPYLRPFLESLESGMIRSDDLRRRGMEGYYGYGDPSKNDSTSADQRYYPGMKGSLSTPLQNLREVVNTATVRSEAPQWEDRHSTSSQARIINYTTSFTVGSEPRAPPTRSST